MLHTNVRTPQGKIILARMNIDLSIIGRRGGSFTGTTTGPSGVTIPSVPTVRTREELRATRRNIERFRSPEVAERESELRSLFTRFTGARETAITRLRSLSPDLFRSVTDQRSAEIRRDRDIRESRIGEVQSEIERNLEEEISSTQALAISGRQKERARLLRERDIAAVEGTSGTTPLTIRFGRGGTEIIAPTGEGIIPQGLNAPIQTSLSAQVRATRLSTNRQQVKRIRDSSSQ